CWRYAAPVEAVNRSLERSATRRLALEATWDRNRLRISSSAPLFQSSPWIAVRTKSGEVLRADGNMHRIDETHWTWAPPPELALEEVGIAGSTDSGASAVFKCLPGESYA